MKKNVKPRIIIVDDEESIRFTLNRYLTQTGYEVCLADNLGDGLSLLEKYDFQVAIVDRMLADGQNGIDFLRHVQKIQSLCQTILISGYPSFDSAAEAILHDPFAYLAKPVRKEEILDTVARALEYGRLRREASHRERLFYSLFNHSPNAVAVYDLEGKVNYINPEFSNLFGYDREEALGKVLPAAPDSDRSQTELIMTELLAGNHVPERETVRLTKDNRTVDVAISLTLCYDEQGRPFEILANIRDISAAKSLERQLFRAQKMEAIGTLAGGIAHDFNNILFPIIGYTEMSLDEIPKDTPAVRYLEQVLKAANRAKSLVDQILSFSRQSEEEIKPLHLTPVIKEVLKLLRASLPASIEIRKDIIPNCRPVLADPTQVHQIMMNLCTNAYHAMRDKGGTLDVTLKEADLSEAETASLNLTPGPYALITVGDTGHGIEPSVLDRIFDPYFTTKKKGEGTGLGLSVVHGIVKKYKGTVTVQSQVGHGSVFSIYLPRVTHETHREESAAVKPLEGGTERILLVDDEKMILDMLEQMLSQLGYQITPRTSSVEALAVFQKKPQAFDLVITDMTMPNMTGMELSEAIREIRPNIPIIICTGFSDNINEEKVKRMGISGYVLKPVLKRKLAHNIRQVMETAAACGPLLSTLQENNKTQPENLFEGGMVSEKPDGSE
jgi:PAS domain S-box-containing protein